MVTGVAVLIAMGWARREEGGGGKEVSMVGSREKKREKEEEDDAERVKRRRRKKKRKGNGEMKVQEKNLEEGRKKKEERDRERKRASAQLGSAQLFFFSFILRWLLTWRVTYLNRKGGEGKGTLGKPKRLDSLRGDTYEDNLLLDVK